MAETVRFKFFSPDKEKHPDEPKRAIQVTFRDVEVLVAWDNNNVEDLAIVAEAMPKIMRQVQQMENSATLAHEAAKDIDAELEELLREQGEE